jgi:hypothetical protein
MVRFDVVTPKYDCLDVGFGVMSVAFDPFAGCLLIP